MEKRKRKKKKDITKELWRQKYPKHYSFYKWLMESNRDVKL